MNDSLLFGTAVFAFLDAVLTLIVQITTVCKARIHNDKLENLHRAVGNNVNIHRSLDKLHLQKEGREKSNENETS